MTTDSIKPVRKSKRLALDGNKLADPRSGISFQPLRFALQPVIKKAAPKGITGHYLQLLTLWPDITQNTHASGSFLHRLSFPKGEQQGATLHLLASNSSQAVFISHDKIHLKNRINQAFGYGLVNDIKVMAAPKPIVPSKNTNVRMPEIVDKSLTNLLN